MYKLVLLCIIMLMLGGCSSAKQDNMYSDNSDEAVEIMEEENISEDINNDESEVNPDMQLIEMELEGCFNYFWNESNSDLNSKGYGITRDSTRENQMNFGSIAATGYALSAYAIGAHKGYVTYEEAHERALNTLKTFYENVPHVNGFFYHFLNLNTAERWNDCEVSIIDTGLFLAGAIVCAEFFGGEVKEYFEKIYDRVNWQWYTNDNTKRFYMGYSDPGSEGQFKGYWGDYAEQLILYVLGAGSKTFPVSGDMFYTFDRWTATTSNGSYIRSYVNGIFVYQYSHGYVDFRNTVDKKGVDWFENSVVASIAARDYCIKNDEGSKTYGENSWGLSASTKKGGYEGAYGIRPNGIPNGSFVDKNDGTIPIYGALASIVFTPEESIAAMRNYYDNYPKLWGKYGFTDCYNLDLVPEYFTIYYLGIDKGDTMVMLSNYQDDFIWEQFMKNTYVQSGMSECGIMQKEE